MHHFHLEYILLYLHRISVFTQNLGQTPFPPVFFLTQSKCYAIFCYHCLVCAYTRLGLTVMNVSNKFLFITYP